MMTCRVPFAAVVAAALLPVNALAATLNFDGDVCTGSVDGVGPMTVCENLSPINQNYGDTAEIDFTFENDSGSGLSMRFWPADYSGLERIAFGGEAPVITMRALAGSTVQLLGFELGAWPNVDRPTQLTVIDIGTMIPILDTGPFTVLGTAPTAFTFTTAVSTSGFRITFGPDGFNVGIDHYCPVQRRV
jgi:hypothetical protein